MVIKVSPAVGVMFRYAKLMATKKQGPHQIVLASGILDHIIYEPCFSNTTRHMMLGGTLAGTFFGAAAMGYMSRVIKMPALRRYAHRYKAPQISKLYHAAQISCYALTVVATTVAGGSLGHYWYLQAEAKRLETSPIPPKDARHSRILVKSPTFLFN